MPESLQWQLHVDTWYPLLPYHQRSIYPATIPAGCLFQKPVVVHFDLYILVRHSPSQDEDFTGYTRYRPWILGPEESLRFEAELVPYPDIPRHIGVQ